MARSEVQSAHHVDNTLYPLQSLPTTETHLNYYSHGVFMYPSHSIEQYDVLVAVSSDANQIQQPAETRNFARLAQPSAFPAAFQERASSIELEGRICAITETPLSQLIPKSMLQLDLTDIGANELTAQHFFPPREFLCLTNSGLYVLTKMRPVDTLCDWLLAARGADTPELRQFFSLYGPDQACAMCLVLACSYYASPKHASDAAQDGGAGATAQGEQRQLNPSLLMSRRSAFSSDVSLAYQVRRDAQLTSYATMCFFGYGGRPTTRQDSDLNVFPSSPGVPVDHGRYHLYGGAVPANYGGASGLSGLVCFSASHDGFALYFSRILQPIWHANLFHASEDGIKCQLQGEPIAQIRAMLYRLKQFLQANPQFAKLRSDCAAPRSREDSPRTPGQRFSQKSNLASTPLYARSPTSNRDPHPVHYHASDGTPEEEPEQLERLSLSNLHHLLLRSIEALEFLDLIADTDILRMNLSMTTKTRILSIKFRDFVISTDSDILRELTNCLNMDYSSQFQDPTVMDKLTTLLRERCPSYFSNVDRIRLQACDLLCRTKSPTITIEERQALLRQSLQQFKQIAKELRPILKQICREYQLLRDYGCVIDLALTCAQQLDPNQNGLTWFKRTKKTAETEQSAYEERMNCYTIITELLDELHSDASPQPTSKTEEPLTEQPLYPPQESTPVTSSPFGNSKHKTSTLFAPQPKFPPPNPASPPSPAQHRASTPPPTDPDSVASPESDSHRVLVHTLRLCTQSNDELWHYVLYQWYIDRNLATDLIRLSTPYLEDYLQHICQPASIRLHLLWQYFLRNDKLLKAAVILMQLADQQDDNQTLSNRLEHLTQAQFLIMAHPEADHRLAEEIQEKVEVARIQFKVYNELQILSDTNLRDQVRAQLDERLYNLSDLFNKFVNKFGLFESALSILHDSGYQDDRLVKRIWNNIIQEEISKSAQLDYSLASLSAKLHSLIQLYYPSQYVFPMDHIVGILEQHSFEVIRTHSSDFYPNWILDTFLRSGVPFIVMFRLYYEFYESRSSYWQGPHQQLHLLRILYHLLFTWKESFGAPSALHDSTLSLQSEYRLLHSKYVNSAIGKFLVTLDSISKLSDPDSASITSAANEVAELFKELKQKIN
ncbi:nuclear pore complex protein Nup155-like [Schistocerca gregaria]|uniref:nuclear pore complex protein Nup155-like n=1 Tax=Schistocerca gregaria TaxID=7010 RepID=UPI00211DA575|nr:nuclear pore complex protein Nup155-like [Schistocerca gregaria]